MRIMSASALIDSRDVQEREDKSRMMLIGSINTMDSKASTKWRLVRIEDGANSCATRGTVSEGGGVEWSGVE